MLASVDLDGRVLDGRYELRGIIGEGSFGRVYRALDRRLGRAVAVKVIKPWWVEDEASVARFRHEAQLLARISDAGIVQIYDFGHAEAGPYYVAELVDGESLEQLLRRGPLTPGQAVSIAEQLCAALGSAHAQGVVHCDVKPANVLIDGSGRVKVGDFGVARFGEGGSQEASVLFGGTPRYMSPEQARGRAPTAASDVYSAGVVLFEMLAGRPPFAGGSAVELGMAHLQDDPPALPEDVPAALREVVGVALCKRPGERYRDGAVMAAALRSARGALHDPGASTAKLAREARAGASRAWSPRDPAPTVAKLPAPIVSTGATVALRKPERDRSDSAGKPPAPPRRPRRSTAGRGRRVALLVAGALVAAAAAVVLLTRGTAKTTVPHLRGLHRSGVLARSRRTHVKPSFSSRYSSAPAGIAIAQRPQAGTRAEEGSTVGVVMSAGPPPVDVPDTVGEQADEAEHALASAGLRYAIDSVPAAGKTPQSVTAQTPGGDARIPRGSTVTLTVVAPPRWRSLTNFSGVDDGQSVPFRIRGERWRVVYSMSYVDTCLLLFVCSGPGAQAEDVSSASSVGEFDLSTGTGHTHVFNSGPGVYRVEISGSRDSARWSATVEDFY